MSNWKTEYKVEYHITFLHEDGREQIISDERIVMADSEEEANSIILDMFENGTEPLTDFPYGWDREISNEDLSIDKIEKIWKY